MTDSVLISAFIQAANYTPDGNGEITRVVIHDMEFPEKDGAARTVANYFKNQAKSTSSGSSAHYCVDNKEIIGCVHEQDRAWHAPPNSGSIGIEHAGYGSQKDMDWRDSYSEAELRLSARLTADLCKRHNLPVVWLSPQDLLAGKKGITSHANVSAAWHKSDHTDPGPNFPIQHYLDLVRTTNGTPPEDDMTADEVEKIVAKYADFTNKKIDEVKSELDALAAKAGTGGGTAPKYEGTVTLSPK